MKIPIPGLKTKDQKNKTIRSFMITKLGKIDDKKLEVDAKAQFEYNDGVYNTNVQARILDVNNQPSFIHIEGVPEPLQFSNIKGAADIKVSADNLKKILRSKLFDDLFRALGSAGMMQMAVNFIAIINFILSILIALKVFGVIDKVMQSR